MSSAVWMVRLNLLVQTANEEGSQSSRVPMYLQPQERGRTILGELRRVLTTVGGETTVASNTVLQVVGGLSMTSEVDGMGSRMEVLEMSGESAAYDHVRNDVCWQVAANVVENEALAVLHVHLVDAEGTRTLLQIVHRLVGLVVERRLGVKLSDGLLFVESQVLHGVQLLLSELGSTNLNVVELHFDPQGSVTIWLERSSTEEWHTSSKILFSI